MHHPDKLDRHKPWPLLPFPPPTEVTVTQKTLLCWLSLLQHSSDRYTAAGAPFTTTTSMCVSVTERCVLHRDRQRWRGLERVWVCVRLRWGGIQEFRWEICVTFSLSWVSQCAHLAMVCSQMWGYMSAWVSPRWRRGISWKDGGEEI